MLIGKDSPCAGSESTVYEARLGEERVAAKKPVLATSDDLDKFHYQLQLLWSVSFALLRHAFVAARVHIAILLLAVGCLFRSWLNY
jgi:hypothetical protein